MGGELLVFLAPVGMLFLVLLLVGIAAERKRIYPIIALSVSLAWAGYETTNVDKSPLLWFFILFAITSLPVTLVTYTIRWFAVRFGEPRGT